MPRCLEEVRDVSMLNSISLLDSLPGTVEVSSHEFPSTFLKIPLKLIRIFDFVLH